MEEMAMQKRNMTIQHKEMAAVHQEKERIRTITTENRKIIERLIETKTTIDNKAPKRTNGYNVITSENRKHKRVESLNLVNRLKESERIML